MTPLEMKHAVAQMALQAFKEQLFAGTSGNLSVFDAESGLLAITPGSVPYPGMTAKDIVLMKPDGCVLEAPHPPSSEWRMHAGIYAALPKVHAIVHTHSPCATSFAVAGLPIPVVLIEMMYFLLGDVPVAPYCKPGTAALGQVAAHALLHRGACLLANHGALAIGSTLEQAHLRAIYTEDAAKICLGAKLLGNLQEISLTEQNSIRRDMGIPVETPQEERL